MQPPGGQINPGALSQIELSYVRRLVGRNSGVVLGEEKAYMISCRLEVFARKQGFSSVREVYERLSRPGNQSFEDEVVDCLLTKETSFFRNPGIFEALKVHVIPEILSRPGHHRLRFWCAACASGQEPYSVAMSLADIGRFQGDGELDLLATDISTAALEQAQQGEYSQMEVARGLPATHLVRYFHQKGHRWCINPSIRDRVRYQKLNLLDPGSTVGRFDIIFCRNVGIYFSDVDKAWLLKKMISSLSPSGYLFLGSSESAFRYSNELKHERWNDVIFYRTKV